MVYRDLASVKAYKNNVNKFLTIKAKTCKNTCEKAHYKKKVNAILLKNNSFAANLAHYKSLQSRFKWRFISSLLSLLDVTLVTNEFFNQKITEFQFANSSFRLTLDDS